MTITLQAVNELIQSLESAGELSIKERKYLELAKEFKQLAAENVGLKAIVDSVTDLSNEPQYHSEGMGCGLEDRGITDRYDACRYGWDEAMERVYGEVIPCAEELDFPATDRIVAGIKTDEVEEEPFGFVSRSGDLVVIELNGDQHIRDGMPVFVKALREGADK